MKEKKDGVTARLKVRATTPGYIGDGPLGMIYRNTGDVFVITPREIPLLNLAGNPELDSAGKLKTKVLSVEDQFSPNWMEVVGENTAEKITTAQQDINEQIKGLNSRGGRGPEADEEVA